MIPGGETEAQSYSGVRTEIQCTVKQIEQQTLQWKYSMFYLQPNSGEMTMTRGFVLISFRSNKGGGNLPKQGHLIYSEPHMTFNTNWCEIFRNITNSWLPLTNYHWFSLSSSSSIFHLFPSSPPPPPFFNTFSHRHWQSSSHRRLKRGSLFFYIMQLSLICSGWIMHCVTNNVTENIFFFLNASSVFWFPQARIFFSPCERICIW